MAEIPDSINSNCPICGCLSEIHGGEKGTWHLCQNCGNFTSTYSALNMLIAENFPTKASFDLAKARVSHMIWKAQSSENIMDVTQTFLETAILHELPTPAEKLDRLLLHLGETFTEVYSGRYDGPTINLQAKIGAFDLQDVHYVAKAGREFEWLQYTNGSATSVTNAYIQVTFKGWLRFEELKKAASDSKMAFMAMKFGEEPLTSVFKDHFKPAVGRTGFHLETVIGKKKAGSIDDKIRVEIRNARFVVVDLTHGNQGAYFEAGFAEGLGKPVIYTCEEVAFDRGRGTHFDCNHHHTVVWKKSDPGEAAEELVDVIRNTLPGEAIMTDK